MAFAFGQGDGIGLAKSLDGEDFVLQALPLLEPSGAYEASGVDSPTMLPVEGGQAPVGTSPPLPRANRTKGRPAGQPSVSGGRTSATTHPDTDMLFKDLGSVIGRTIINKHKLALDSPTLKLPEEI